MMTKVISSLIRLAYPLILGGLAQNAVYFFETLFLSKLGADVLAAGSLVGWLAATFVVVLFGVLGAMNILISHRFGAKKHHEIAYIVRDGMRFSLLISIPSMLIYWYMDVVFLWLGQDPHIIPIAKLYLHALTWSLVPNFLNMCFLELLIGLGHTKVIMRFTLITVLITIFSSFILIFGYLGLPRLGIAGAGWGISIGAWFSLLLMSIFFIYRRDYHPYLSKIFDFKPAMYIKKLIKIGLPIGLMYGIEITFLFILSLLVGALGGAKYLAANQIALQYLGITMALVFCISQAITVQIGHLLGAQKKSQIFAVIWAGSGLSIGFTLILSFIFWFFPSYLIGIDIDISKVSNQQLVALSKNFLFLCGCYQLLEALRIALFGAIRALHDTQFTMWVSLFSLWGLALPLGFVLGRYSQMGAYGLWWGMMFGILIGNFILIKRLMTKKYL